jgi:iron complex outermembrane recepter protein
LISKNAVIQHGLVPMRAAPVRPTSMWLAMLMAITGAAHAETPADSTVPASATAAGSATTESSIEAITVTGSRIARPGFESPTPVSTITQEDINIGGRANIGDFIDTMPQVRASFSTTSTTNQSLVGSGNFVDLRGLGEVRTLVLVDGKRFVPENRYGDVDLDVIPQALIENVDIVTGGASAAYGSNAVAGVVNLRLNHDLQGFKGTVQGGRTDHDDNRNALVSLAYGSHFLDDRLKLIVGAEYSDNEGVPSVLDRDWGRANWGIITNPNYVKGNGQPARLLVSNVGMSNSTLGGLINSGPLKGIQFGPGGTPIPFNYGSLVTGTTMVGGDGQSTSFASVLESPLSRYSTYGRLSFDFNDSVTAYTEISYAETSSTVPSNVIPNDQVTISRDNAFLPASIGAAMDRDGLTNFTMGRVASDYAHEVYSPDYRTSREVAGLDGKLPAGWSWHAYYTHGDSDQDTTWTNRDNARFALATDAVINPATGAAVCRSTLTNPNNGCQPADLFGSGSVSAAATNYMVINTFIDTQIKQDAAEFSFQGEPFSTWAGPVSLAVGADWRREETAITSGLPSQGGTLFDANQVPWSGVVSTKEGFAEVVAPLAKDQVWAKAVDLNLAARVTDYNTSGTVATWKGGVTYDINDSVRLRGTRSRDIRAPNANELFAKGGQVGHFTVLDPVTGNSESVAEYANGNPDLKPEIADTTTVGIVFNPSFVPRLHASLDFYDIKVSGAILSFDPQTVVDLCNTSEPGLCGMIKRGADGNITEIDNAPRNLQEQHIAGADFELTYSLPADSFLKDAPGDLSFHTTATYVSTITLQDASGSYLQLAGSMEQPTIQSIGGQPHLRGNITTTYTVGATTLSATGRYVGGGKLRNEWGPLDINQVTSSSRTYLDLFASRDVLDRDGMNVQLFASIVNATNRDPPITEQGGVTTRALYDVIGRTYTIGARFHF